VSGTAAGAVEHAVGRQPDPDPVRTDGRDRGTGHLERKAIAAFDAVAVIVAAPIHIGIQELLDQIAIGGMQLDAIEARFDGELRRPGVLVHCTGDGASTARLRAMGAMTARLAS
jgi:hypothetical protein